jgi:glycosyltransferase involved in cell wall biosynthesis
MHTPGALAKGPKTGDATHPMLSIGLPVYNGERYLEKSLESIVSQTFSDFELIISDNASTDGTEAICRRFAAADSRIRYVRSPVNRGMAWNFRQVFELAQSEYFLWAAHDDYFAPQYAERCLQVLKTDPKVVLCYSQVFTVDDGGAVKDQVKDGFRMDADDPKQRLREIVEELALCNACFGVMRSAALRQTPVHANYVGSDIPLLAELALHGPFHELPDPLFFRRLHPGASGQANPTEEQLAVFYDPTQKGIPPIRYWHHFYGFLTAILRAPIGTFHKLRCLGFLFHWSLLNRHRLFGELGGLVRRTRMGRMQRILACVSALLAQGLCTNIFIMPCFT